MAAGKREIGTESKVVQRLVVSSIAWLGLLALQQRMNCGRRIRGHVEQNKLVGLWHEMLAPLMPLPERIKVRPERIDQFLFLLRCRGVNVCIQLDIIANAPFFFERQRC